MATAELVRKSPFEAFDLRDFSQAYVAYTLLWVGVLGGISYWAYFVAPPQFTNPALALVGVVYFFSILKNRVFGFVGLVFAIGLSPDSVGFSNVRLEDYLLPPVLILWWLQRSANREPLIESKVLNVAKVYMIIAAFATVKGYLGGTVWTYGHALSFYFKYAEYFLILWFGLNNFKRKEDVVILLISSFMVCSLVAYLALQGRKEVLAEGVLTYVRAKGPQGETPNVLGGYYMLHVMFGFALVFAVKNYLYKLALAGFLLIVAFPLLYTYSRTSFASLVVGLMVTCVFIDMRYIFLVGTIVVFNQLFIPQVQEISTVDETVFERYSTIFDIFQDDDESKPSSWTARWTGWYIYYTRTVNYDPLFGRGVGSVGLGVDSSFVKKFIESGLIGLLAFVLFLVRVGRKGLETVRLEKDNFLRAYAVGYMGILAGMIVHSVGVSSFSTIRTATPFFLFTGILLAINAATMRAVEENEEDERDRSMLRFSSLN